MTDKEIVERARKIDILLQKVRDIYNEISESEHPNADKICQALDDNQIYVCAWARHVVSHYLQYPEKWETGNWGIRYKK